MLGVRSSYRALYTFYSGKAEEAVRLNTAGLNLIDQVRDPILFMMAVHNQLLFLVDLGQCDKAKRVLFENRQHLLYENRIRALRLRWLEARISYGLQELLSAEIAFRETRDGLAKLDLMFHSGLASLEHAMVLLVQGHFEEAENEVQDVLEVFIGSDFNIEYLGAVSFLRETFRLRVITPDFMETTVAHIRRTEIELGIRPTL